MDKEKFISKIQSRKRCSYIYNENERNENTGLIQVWLYNGQIILTWEESPAGLQYDESPILGTKCIILTVLRS